MGKAKYKVGDVVKIRPGIFISERGKKSDDNTFGVITDVREHCNFDFTPDYRIDLSLNGFVSDDDLYYIWFDELFITGCVGKFCKEEDIYAEEISLLL